jgi:ElaB/YqjD/DUF883 family membrane-anchored ribosome-binding protein
MTQQRASYPLDYSKGPGEGPKDAQGRTSATPADRMDDAAAMARDATEQLAQKVQQYGEQAQDAVKKFRPYAEKSMKEQPMATLAIAAAIGAVLGALCKK